MGIRQLLPTLRRIAPSAFIRDEAVWLAKLPPGSGVAIDAPIYAYKHGFSAGRILDDELLDYFLGLCRALERRNLVPKVVFDGPHVRLKDGERKKRADAAARTAALKKEREENTTKLYEDEADDALDVKYGIVPPVDTAADVVPCAPTANATTVPEEVPSSVPVDGEAASARPASPGPPAEAEREASPKPVDVEREASPKPLARLPYAPTKQNYVNLQRGLEASGYECIEAKHEAEATSAYLCSIGAAAAVLTDDTDALAAGAPLIICKFGSSECFAVEHAAVLRETGLIAGAFLDACLLLKNDFADGIPGFGPQKIFHALQKAQSAEAVLAWGRATRHTLLKTDVAKDYVERVIPTLRRAFRGYFGETDAVPDMPPAPVFAEQRANGKRKRSHQLEL